MSKKHTTKSSANGAVCSQNPPVDRGKFATQLRGPAEANFDDLGTWAPAGMEYSEFLTTVATTDCQRHSGLGLELDHVIHIHQAFYRRCIEGIERDRANGDTDQTAEQYASNYDDQVIWLGGMVRAVLIAEPHGKPYFLVTRFDRGTCTPTVATPDNPAPYDVADLAQEGGSR
jgi:hypothetical protein